MADVTLIRLADMQGEVIAQKVLCLERFAASAAEMLADIMGPHVRLKEGGVFGDVATRGASVAEWNALFDVLLKQYIRSFGAVAFWTLVLVVGQHFERLFVRVHVFD